MSKNRSYSKYKELIFSYIEHNRNFLTKLANQRILHNKLKVPVNEMYSKVHGEAAPVFVLSTGRAGTKLLTNVLGKASSFYVAHSAYPELNYFSGLAYLTNQDKSQDIKQVIDAARYEIIRDNFILNKTYIETNNRVTFFAPQLAELYPKAKFIHLKREAYQFIESGLARNWYANEKLFDEGRIKPATDTIPWNQYSQLQKIAWLWAETNGFISSFFKTIDDSRTLSIRSENLYCDPETTKSIFRFCGGEALDTNTIKRIIKTPVNTQNKKRALEKEDHKIIDDLLNSLTK